MKKLSIIDFISVHYDTYGAVKPQNINIQTEDIVFYTGEFLIILKDKGDYYYNTWFLFDINQVEDLRKTVREFKNIIRSSDKPIIVGNVSDKFKRYTTPIGCGKYTWRIK